MNKHYFPHISQIIPERALLTVKKALIFTIVAVLFITSLYGIFYPEHIRFSQVKQNILIYPFTPQTHIALGQLYLNQGETSLAEKEFYLAQNLSLMQNSPDNNILGQAISLLNQIRNEPQRIENQITQWKTIVEKYPDYRDGYIQLAAFSYQLKRIADAVMYTERALEIDPNFEPAIELRDLLQSP